jgi:hypothetical protein
LALLMINFVGGRLRRGNGIHSLKEKVYRSLQRKSFPLGNNEHNRTSLGYFRQKHDFGGYLHLTCVFLSIVYIDVCVGSFLVKIKCPNE